MNNYYIEILKQRVRKELEAMKKAGIYGTSGVLSKLSVGGYDEMVEDACDMSASELASMLLEVSEAS